MLYRFSQRLRTARSGVKILLFLALCIPMEAVTIGFLRLFHWQGGSEGFLRIWPIVGVLYGVTWLFQRMEREEALEPWGSRFMRQLRLFGSGLALGGLIILLAALCVLAIGGFHWRLGSEGLFASIVKAFPIWLALAMVEEGVFRGYVFQKLIDGIGLRWAQGLCALLFALIHWHNRGMSDLNIKVVSTLNLFLLALLFGFAWHRTRSLALPVGLHVAWNWVQGSFLGFRVSGIPVTGHLQVVLHRKPTWIHGGAFGLEASLAATAVLALFLVALLRKDALHTSFAPRSVIEPALP